MCLIVWAWQAHPHYPLIVLANRDEFLQRPTRTLHRWEGEPAFYAGKDLKAGGTWMGISEAGRWAAVTNYRRSESANPQALSRGHLVLDFLQSEQTPEDHLTGLETQAQQYNPFNLLVGNRNTLAYYSNQTHAYQLVKPGIHGLSNALLDTPWPKVKAAKAAFESEIESDDPPVEKLLKIMQNDATYALADLPDTGIGMAREKQLSPIFIRAGLYGTCSTSLLMWHQSGKISFYERRYETQFSWKDRDCQFQIKPE